MVWKIESAIKSGIFERIIVSTDDQEIADIAKKFGAEVPFIRPAEFALDATPTITVIRHALLWLREKENYEPDVVMLLEPTTPAVQPFHIKEALGIFLKTDADSVVSIVDVPTAYNPYWQFIMSDDGRLSLFTGSPIGQIIGRRQDLPKTYHRNSALYVFKPQLALGPDPSLYGDNIYAYKMDLKYSSDIDTLEDWIEAENKMRIILE